MDDIVARLREAATRAEGLGRTRTATLLRDAADEIERLRALAFGHPVAEREVELQAWKPFYDPDSAYRAREPGHRYPDDYDLVEIMRDSWPEPSVVDPRKLPPAMNVDGLRWRPAPISQLLRPAHNNRL